MIHLENIIVKLHFSILRKLCFFSRNYVQINIYRKVFYIVARYGYEKAVGKFRNMLKDYNRLIFEINTATSTSILDKIDKKLKMNIKNLVKHIT